MFELSPPSHQIINTSRILIIERKSGRYTYVCMYVLYVVCNKMLFFPPNKHDSQFLAIEMHHEKKKQEKNTQAEQNSHGISNR